LTQRKFDLDTEAATAAIGSRHRTAMQLDDAACDSEPQPISVFWRGGGGAKKWRE
jgi:hypothetical protein